VQVDDFEISSSKIGDSTERLVDRAVEEARRRDHGLLSNEHLFLAFAQLEWDLFADVMHDLALNPQAILEATEAHLRAIPPLASPRLRVASTTKLVFKLALHRATRSGKQMIEAIDVVAAVLDETQGMAAVILARHGADPNEVVYQLHERMRDLELRQERLKKRFELPMFLKQFASRTACRRCLAATKRFNRSSKSSAIASVRIP
jgi:ATP-dependent Clp protease ATP-binding subunit ClpA